MAREVPIYSLVHDMLAWPVPHLEGWARPQRFLLAQQVLETATQFYRLLLCARKVDVEEQCLILLDADMEADRLCGAGIAMPVRLSQQEQEW